MSTDAAAMSEKPVEQVERLLEGTNDDHDGLMVEMTPDPLDPALFAATLKASLSHWRLQVYFFFFWSSRAVHTCLLVICLRCFV